ncbi:hypothetical protein DM02DRAFT_179224 [Periconia macrospinosa]|uniref:SET domain-containing protein n=1 Tax=Periconia macrospinosa TaxID=97972 RepID=A0A2V1E496_9PLEO|nr:hypothetical protein DM02DRAFT_179224 [Periconia macrospinosa]
MTDVSSVKAHADIQPASVAVYAGPQPYLNGSPALDGTVEAEESSTIKCICGFADDDGNTVLCEKCDTWQHILCYYDHSPVPDVHLCTDCLPRPIDTKSAVEKQRQHREGHAISERKGRPRTTTKSHKKRVKDPLVSVQPNGWAVHSNNDLQYNSERKSGSPRDQGPPAKRPKTSHRSSGSIVSQAPALVPSSRKRTGSVMYNGHSPVKSPTESDGPIEDFSIEFMNLYRQPEPQPTKTNSYTDLRVANDIASWLNDRDALVEATGGISPAHVFQRIEQSIEDMEASHAPAIIKQTDEDPRVTAHNLHPQWQFLVADSGIADGGFIGELKGRIGRKQDYFTDPANRWDLLRHPEPFVFFPPHLPIYIDTRQEGTILRYARRSCKPNMVMKILTQGAESGYHFCFLAMRDIEPGEELTIGWDIDHAIRLQLEKAVTNGDIKKEGFKKIQPWVACVLANFGGCACDTATGHECLLERARRNATTNADSLQPLKSTKGRKTKKAQVSPMSTGRATNSRAGSEALLRDAPDDDNAESRSTSGSHKSSSRDITPATHLSVDDGTSKMSERERRKLQQQERLFEQLEYDEQHKGKRGKRNSAGSTLNTPGLSSKQFGHGETSASSTRNPREHSNGVARKTSGNSTRANGRAPPKPRPEYVEASTQTDDDKMDAVCASPLKGGTMRPPPMSYKRKLLLQAQDEKLQRERTRSASVKVEAKSPPAILDALPSKPSPVAPSVHTEESTAMDISVEPPTEPKPKEPSPPPKEVEVPVPTPTVDIEVKDVEMPDAEETPAPLPPVAKVEEMPDAPNPEHAPEPAPEPGPEPPQAPAELPPSPWPNPGSTTQVEPKPSTEPAEKEKSEEKPASIRLEVPEKTDTANSIPSPKTLVTPGSVSSVPTASAVAQSPVVASSAPSPFSPAVTNAVTPGPARKKLSLSDYTSRRAKLAQQTSHPSVTPPPVFQATSSPTMEKMSLASAVSPSEKVEAGLPTVAEETKPAEAPTDVPATNTTITTSPSASAG